MNKRVVELFMGATVIFTCLFLLVGMVFSVGEDDGDTIALQARFLSVDGLQQGSDVRINGVRVGEVVGIGIDEEFYEVIVSIEVARNLRIPENSTAAIRSNGLLGGRYIAIEPGNDDNYLEDQALIAETLDSASLEDLLGRAVFVVSKAAQE